MPITNASATAVVVTNAASSPNVLCSAPATTNATGVNAAHSAIVAHPTFVFMAVRLSAITVTKIVNVKTESAQLATPKKQIKSKIQLGLLALYKMALSITQRKKI